MTPDERLEESRRRRRERRFRELAPFVGVREARRLLREEEMRLERIAEAWGQWLGR